MLKVNQLTIGYGDRLLVRDISFEVAPGECVLLAGANGTGKTTLLKVLAEEGVCSENLRSQSDLRPSHKWAPPSNVPRVAQVSDPLPTSASVRKSVVFPVPLAPASRTHSPGTISKEMSRTRRRSPYPMVN